MATEIYILKLRILSALRWIRELGFIRIIAAIVIISAVFKSFLDINNFGNGILFIIFLNLSLISSIHFSRKDGFFLDSLNINKKIFYTFEYFLYSIPFLLLILLSQYYYFSVYIILLLTVFVNIKSGTAWKINFKSNKSLFPVYAFEWRSGIRTNFFPVLIIYIPGLALSYQIAGSILAIILLTLIFSSFFIENEPLLLIEAYKLSPKKFVLKKIAQTAKIYLVFIMPLVLAHLVFFYERWYMITGLLLFCQIIIISSVLTKYAFYSEEISSSKMNYLITGLVVFSFVSIFYMTGPFLLPLPFFIVYYLYKKAVRNLQNNRFISF